MILINNKNVTFESKDFSKQLLIEYDFSGCIFKKCNFTETSFEDANLWNCTFIECNFNLVNLKNCQFNNVSFKESKIMGVDFSRCNTSLFFSINIEECFLQYCSFFALEMNNTSLIKSKIIQCKFINTKLKKSSFYKSDLAGSTFGNSDLREANFKDAINYLINPCENKIKSAIFSSPECLGLVKSLDIKIIE